MEKNGHLGHPCSVCVHIISGDTARSDAYLGRPLWHIGHGLGDLATVGLGFRVWGLGLGVGGARLVDKDVPEGGERRERGGRDE